MKPKTPQTPSRTPIERFFVQRRINERRFRSLFPDLDYQTELKRMSVNQNIHSRFRIRASKHIKDPPNATSNTNTLHKPVINGGNVYVNGSNFHIAPPPRKRRRSSTAETYRDDGVEGDEEGEKGEKGEDGEDGEDEEDEEEGKEEVYDSDHSFSPPPSWNLILPSGVSLRQLWAKHGTADPMCTAELFCIEQFQSILSPKDLKFLHDHFPALPPVSDYFKSAIEACRPFWKDALNHANYPKPPTYVSVEDLHTWQYVSAAVQHHCLFGRKIKERAIFHGEVWADVNVWSHLFDFGFLGSSTLTVDRKELRTAARTSAHKHDGIVRSAVVRSGYDLGFIEVKPVRQYSDDMATDRKKVYESVVATLKKHNTPGAIVIGIICEGMNYTILRATMFEGVCLAKVYNQTLCHGKLLTIIEQCWKLQLALEESYQKIINALPDEDFV